MGGSRLFRDCGAAIRKAPSRLAPPNRIELRSMTLPAITPSQVRSMLLLRDEIALLDVRHEAAYATGHPLFAANMAADRIGLEAASRLPRRDVPIAIYDAGKGLAGQAAERF